MRTPLTAFLFATLSLTAACGGGGSSGGGAPGGGDQSRVTPPTPAGAGAAGAMNGRWVVTSAELVPDPSNRNAQVENAAIGVDAIFDFVNGQLVSLDGEDPRTPPGSRGYPANDFYSNSGAGGVTTVLLGATFPPDFLGGGMLRMGFVFGTTSPTHAVAESIEWYEFGNPPVSSWGHYRAILERR